MTSRDGAVIRASRRRIRPGAASKRGRSHLPPAAVATGQERLNSVLSKIAASRFGGSSRWKVRRGRRAWIVEVLEPRLALSAGATSVPIGQAIPASVNLTSVFTDAKFNRIPYEQEFSDCVANAVAADIDFNILKSQADGSLIDEGFRPSRLFLYYDSRFLGYQSNVKRSQTAPFTDDTGTNTLPMLTSAATQGIATEGNPKPGFPYPAGADSSLLTKNPGAANYLAARTVRVTSYHEFSKGQLTPAYILAQLAAGEPVLIGISVPTEKAAEGTRGAMAIDPDRLIAGAKGSLPSIPKPGTTYRPGPDGHEMLLVGYNNQKQEAIVLNSWGKDWGKDGYAYLPYVYLNQPWMGDAATIAGVAVSTTPTASIGKLTQLTYRQGVVDGTRGQINVDTQPSSSSANLTATSFDFYSHTNGSHYVTPLVFNFDASSQTYTLTGIGASFKPAGDLAKKNGDAQGIPFVAHFGSADITATSRFGFYDGDVTSAGVNEVVKASIGVIPYSAAGSGSSAWLSSTGPIQPGGPEIGMTLSNTTQANVTLTRADARTYSAMLNE
jgi:Papain family cysteine protease